MSHQNITSPWKTKQTFETEDSTYRCSPPRVAHKNAQEITPSEEVRLAVDFIVFAGSPHTSWEILCGPETKVWNNNKSDWSSADEWIPHSESEDCSNCFLIITPETKGWQSGKLSRYLGNISQLLSSVLPWKTFPTVMLRCKDRKRLLHPGDDGMSWEPFGRPLAYSWGYTEEREPWTVLIWKTRSRASPIIASLCGLIICRQMLPY